MKKKVPGQLGTIIKFSLLMELRGKVSKNPRRHSYRVLLALAIIYLFSGAFLGLLSSGIADPFTASFIVSTFFMLLIGSFILLEYPTLITGPEDFYFYASKPLSPRIYFTGKSLTTLVIVSLLFLFFILPYTVVSLLFQRPLSFLAGSFLAIYLSGLSITLVIINLYGLLVKFIPPRIIRGVASLFQLLAISSVYVINSVVTRSIREGLLNFRIELTGWVLLIPAAWSNALFRITTEPVAGLFFAWSLAAVPLILFLGARFISLDYAARIADNALRSENKTAPVKSRSDFWPSPEAFAVSRIIINQFKYNSQFRMGIITIIPITVIYFLVVLFSNGASILDPFTPAGRDAFMGTFVLYVAIGFFPVYIKNALTYSTEAEASWVFFTAPASRIALITACRRFILVFFLFPYLLLFSLVFGLFTAAWVHTLMHFLIITLLGMILTNFFLFFLAEIPFARTYQKGHHVTQVFLRLALAFMLPLALTGIVFFAYPQVATYWLAVAVLLLCLALSEWGGRRRASKRLAAQEFLE